jgi:uncharacterized protein YlzI (FlbEa/FlbD family)
MIFVTQKDGTSLALNIDRLERIERNGVDHGRGSNVVLVGGGHLVVEESQETLVERVMASKAAILAEARAMSDSASARVPGAPPLRMVSPPGRVRAVTEPSSAPRNTDALRVTDDSP